MAIRVAWDRDDPRIIRAVFEGSWSLQEFRAVVDQIMVLANSRPQPVGVIIDVSASAHLPGNFMGHATKHIEQPDSSRKRNVAIYTVVGASTVIQAMYNAFFRVFPASTMRQRVVLVDDAADARTLIAARLEKVVETVYE